MTHFKSLMHAQKFGLVFIYSWLSRIMAEINIQKCLGAPFARGIFFVILSPVLLGGSELSAANIVVEYDMEMGCGIILDGKIEDGDLDRLKAALEQYRELDRTSKKFVDGRLCLNSKGGSFLEAVKIAEYLLTWSAGTATAVARDSVCESACSIIFMAGRETINSARFLHPSARLGFHAPSIAEESLPNQRYSKEDIAASYAVALKSVASLVELQGEENWFFPPSLFVTMLETPPEEMSYVETIGDAASWAVDIYPVEYPSDFSSRSWHNSCVNLIARLFGTPPRPFDFYATADVQWEGEGGPAGLHIDESDIQNGVFSIHAGEGSYCVFDFSDAVPDGLPEEFWIRQQISGNRAVLKYVTPYDGGREVSAQTESRTAAWMFLSPDTKLTDVKVSQPHWKLQNWFSRHVRETAFDVTDSDIYFSCWLASPSARITNVNEYVNLRRRPDFSAPVIRQVPLGEQVSATRAANITVIGQERDRQSCITACQAFGANSEDGNARDRVQLCIDDNMLWYEITDARGNRGWVSRKFLEEVE